MSAKAFLDTNIVIYAHSDLNLAKQSKAQSIIQAEDTLISTQVLQETANILFKKFKNKWPDISKVLADLIANNTIYINKDSTVVRACLVASQYGFSFYDSLIISSAIESGVEILYSEDMQHNQLIEKQVRIINPFI